MAPVVVHLNGGCCSPSAFEKLAQPDYDQEIEQINVTYGRRQWCTSKLGPAIGLITCTGFVLIFCGILAFSGSIGDFAEEIGEPCRRRLQTGSCCIATAGGDQFLCQSSTEFFCTGAGKRCTWTCAAPPPPPGGTSDTSGCDEEDVKPPLLNVFIRLGFVIFLAGAKPYQQHCLIIERQQGGGAPDWGQNTASVAAQQLAFGTGAAPGRSQVHGGLPPVQNMPPPPGPPGAFGQVPPTAIAYPVQNMPPPPSAYPPPSLYGAPSPYAPVAYPPAAAYPPPPLAAYPPTAYPSAPAYPAGALTGIPMYPPPPAVVAGTPIAQTGKL